MIRRLAHVCLKVPDLDAMHRFCVEALGLSVKFEFRRGDERIGFYVACGEHTFIEVFAAEEKAPGNVDHLCLEVEDLDAAIARARAAGFDLLHPRRKGRDHSWQAWLLGPGGVRVEFHEYTPESLQVNGGVCQVDW